MEILIDDISVNSTLVGLSVTLGSGEFNSRLNAKFTKEVLGIISLNSYISINNVGLYEFIFPVSSYIERTDGSITVSGSGLRSANFLPTSMVQTSISTLLKSIDSNVINVDTPPNSLVVRGTQSTAKTLYTLAKRLGLKITDTGTQLIVRSLGDSLDIPVIESSIETTIEGTKLVQTTILAPNVLPGDVINGYDTEQVEHDFVRNLTTTTSVI